MVILQGDCLLNYLVALLKIMTTKVQCLKYQKGNS